MGVSYVLVVLGWGARFLLRPTACTSHFTIIWTIFFKSEFNMKDSVTSLMFTATKTTHKTETSLLQRSNISIATDKPTLPLQRSGI